jgi:PAS domain S-box-containing protein
MIKSGQIYKLIVENVNELVTIINKNLEIEYINEEVHKKITGYANDNLIGENISKFVDQDDHEKFIEEFNRSIKSGKIKTEVRIKHRNGHFIWTETNGKTFQDIDGETKVLTISRDITERKKTEEKLKESEERYRLISENATELITVQNDKFQIEYVNETPLKNILGYSKEEMVGTLAIQHAHPEDMKDIVRSFNKVLDKKKSPYQVRYIHKNGNHVWLEITLESFLNSQGEKKYLTISRDITKQKRFEDLLKESEEKFRTITEDTHLGIMIVQKGLIKYTNQAMATINGYSREKMVTWTMNDMVNLVHPEDLKFVMEQFKNNLTANSEVVANNVYRIITKSGEMKWIETYAKNFVFEGSIAALIAVLDISEKINMEKKLKESEEMYRLISESANDLIRVLNDRFEFEYINEKVHKRLLGYTLEDLKNKTHLPFLHSEDRRRAIRSTVRNLKRGEGSYEARFKDKNGNYRWFEIAGKYFYTSKGEKKILSIARDINERKNAEFKLRESEKKYRLISETVYDLIGVLNKKFKYNYINENAFQQILGYSNKDLLGKSALKFIHPDDLSNVAQTLFEGFKKGEEQAELRFRHKDGHWVWLESKGKTYLDVDGELKALVISRDITQSKIAADKVKESEEKYRSFVEQSQDGVVLVNENGSIIEWNKAQENIFGIKREDVLGKDLWEIQYQAIPINSRKEEIYEYFKATITQALKTGNSPWLNSIREFQIHVGNNHNLIGQQSSFLIKTKNGFMLGCNMRDVTKIKEAEQKLKESEEKYRKAYNRAQFYKDLFVHDMSNILAVINSSAELIPFYCGESEKSKKIKSITDILRNQIDRGAKLVSNVHILSELEEDLVPLEDIDINSLLMDSIEFIKNSFKDRELQIKLEKNGGIPKVIANQLIREVFDNILINGIKYNENHSIEVTIKTSTKALNKRKYVKIEFIDNGIGIPDERKEIIFKAGNREIKGSKGMGIGLSLVKKIIKGYDGKIWIENRVKDEHEKGSNFILLIPQTNHN